MRDLEFSASGRERMEKKRQVRAGGLCTSNIHPKAPDKHLVAETPQPSTLPTWRVRGA